MAKTLVLEGLTRDDIVFKHFDGDRYHNVTIGVKLADDVADQLIAEDWPVKTYIPKSEDYEPFRWLQVSFKFDPYPPTVVTVDDGKATEYDKDTIKLLQPARFDSIDIQLSWPARMKEDGSGFGKTIYCRELLMQLTHRTSIFDRHPEINFGRTEEEVPFE